MSLLTSLKNKEIKTKTSLFQMTKYFEAKIFVASLPECCYLVTSVSYKAHQLSIKEMVWTAGLLSRRWSYRGMAHYCPWKLTAGTVFKTDQNPLKHLLLHHCEGWSNTHQLNPHSVFSVYTINRRDSIGLIKSLRRAHTDFYLTGIVDEFSITTETLNYHLKRSSHKH